MQNYNKANKSDKMEVDDVDSKSKRMTPKMFLDKNQKSKMFTKAAASAVYINSTNVETIPSTVIKTKVTSLAFVPRQVQKSFSKILTNNQNREKNVLESETMMELAESLPN